MAGPKKIVITGVTRGLGRALAEVFIQSGHVVWGCGRSADKIVELRNTHMSPQKFSVVDVTDLSQVERWSKEVLADGKAPDLLINNAAVVNSPSPLQDVSAEEFSDLIDINIKGVFYCLKAFLPSMTAMRQGVIVNLSSGWGRSVSPEVAPYCASKYAIEGLSKALAEEVPSGIAVVPLNPGIIDTDMLRVCFGASARSYPNAREWAKTAAPFILNISPKDNGRSLSVT